MFFYAEYIALNRLVEFINYQYNHIVISVTV
jgi:hypothetical protein